MDCGVQVDAGKPLIIAEYRLKTLTDLRQACRFKGGRKSKMSGSAGMQTDGSGGPHVQGFFPSGLGNSDSVARQIHQGITDPLPFMPENPGTKPWQITIFL